MGSEKWVEANQETKWTERNGYGCKSLILMIFTVFSSPSSFTLLWRINLQWSSLLWSTEAMDRMWQHFEHTCKKKKQLVGEPLWIATNDLQLTIDMCSKFEGKLITFAWFLKCHTFSMVEVGMYPKMNYKFSASKIHNSV